MTWSSVKPPPSPRHLALSFEKTPSPYADDVVCELPLIIFQIWQLIHYDRFITPNLYFSLVENQIIYWSKSDASEREKSDVGYDRSFQIVDQTGRGLPFTAARGEPLMSAAPFQTPPLTPARRELKSGPANGVWVVIVTWGRITITSTRSHENLTY